MSNRALLDTVVNPPTASRQLLAGQEKCGLCAHRPLSLGETLGVQIHHARVAGSTLLEHLLLQWLVADHALRSGLVTAALPAHPRPLAS